MTAIDKGTGALLPARRIAEFAAALRYEDIPATVRERARIQILDGLGVGFASNAFAFADRALAGLTALGGAGDCTVLGRRQKLPLRDAALANGILVHGLDFDDTHLASIVHATAACLPAALTLAEALDASGEEFLTAYTAGMEVAIRIGAAVKGGFHHAGYHATGIVSHFSNAVVAGRLLQLSAEQILHAQGIASSSAAGLQVFLEEGAWTKRFHPGWGAVAGITAAHLAQHGFIGPSRPYEGKFGLFESHLQAHAAEADVAALSDGLGERWDLADTAIKPYPVCHFIHGAADSAIALRERIPSVEAIRSVRILVPAQTLPIVAEPAADKLRPATDYAAKFSAPFVVATCLRLGRFGLAELLPQALADEATLALAARSRCEADPDTAFPTYFSGGVEVTLQDGSTLRWHERVNSGAGERKLDVAGASAKFMGAAGMVLDTAIATRARDAILAIDRHPIRHTTAVLGGS
ncbi:2-methylcitrate dehydratase [Siccirubricoccus deserti]|uniref:MmgE/PrpD family protein n=1 Tax=Siccirubricoccus deserti TaxID=2013562 RepID=A0A9X0QYZ3_9PROT|nr:MmgE/PrpD family protein [Siccirubricoccus deserti]MBC4016475.1 MmgE/PrpD family protein [Siccirubricoccus deserti]GGC48712.1 2-methylcitrate dehydratase [Siccirubricoccus deserti]